MTARKSTGSIGWIDLTVDKADQVRDFYHQVTGWRSEPTAMDNYDDYCMFGSASDQPVAGICHARGPNAGLPAQWLVYVTVDDLNQRVAKCVELGGQVIAATKDMGSAGRYCVIEDPAGAVAALFEPAENQAT